MRKIVKIVTILLITIGFHSVSAQETTNEPLKMAKNTFYAEVLGKGFYYSVNYERNIYAINDKISFQGSIGFCFITGSYSEGYTDNNYKELVNETYGKFRTPDFTMPLELNVKYSLGNHHIVAGYGTTYWRYYLPEIEITNSNWDQQPVPVEMKRVREWFAHGVLEYRWQKPEGGLMAKIGWTPLFFAKMENFKYQKKVNFANSFNLGVGYSF